jgi:hypothetical protein
MNRLHDINVSTLGTTRSKQLPDGASDGRGLQSIMRLTICESLERNVEESPLSNCSIVTLALFNRQDSKGLLNLGRSTLPAC